MVGENIKETLLNAVEKHNCKYVFIGRSSNSSSTATKVAKKVRDTVLGSTAMHIVDNAKHGFVCDLLLVVY